MPSTIFGLPLHPLIVHATVVFVPLAVLAVITAVLLPRFRRWAGPMPMLLSLVSLILTPLSTSSGENLESSVASSKLVEEHAHLGDQLLPFTIALFVLSAAFWWISSANMATTTAGRGRPLVRAVGAVALVAALGTGVQVARIGHSGAKAAWSQSADATPGTQGIATHGRGGQMLT